MKKRNFVQKHVQEYNVPQVFADRKARMKRGYIKHKNKLNFS